MPSSKGFNISVVFFPANNLLGADSCQQTIIFIVPLILLAVICIFSTAMAAYFCMKVGRGNKQGLDGPYKN